MNELTKRRRNGNVHTAHSICVRPPPAAPFCGDEESCTDETDGRTRSGPPFGSCMQQNKGRDTTRSSPGLSGGCPALPCSCSCSCPAPALDPTLSLLVNAEFTQGSPSPGPKSGMEHLLVATVHTGRPSRPSSQPWGVQSPREQRVLAMRPHCFTKRRGILIPFRLSSPLFPIRPIIILIA